MHTDQFEIWLAKSNIPDGGKTIIKQIRCSQPVRNVAGGRSNVTGPYPSKKMGVTIQFESHTVELAFIREYEFDDDVLEYYDQPGPIHIEYLGKGNRKIAVYTTPDYFVIRRDGTAGWEECKKLQELESFTKKSNRFILDDKEWRSPSSEKYAEQYGLYFRVRSSNEINWVWQRNIEYLSDYLQKESPTCDSKTALVATALVRFKQGILLSELLANTQLFCPDDIFTLIANDELYVDIQNYALAEQERVPVFSDELHSRIDLHSELPVETATSISIEAGQTILWDGKPFVIVNVADKLWLKNCDNPPIQLSRVEIEHLVKQNHIKGQRLNKTDSFVLNILTKASPDDFKMANERLKAITPFLNNCGLRKKTTRSIRHWLKKYRDHEKAYGYGYIGLLSNTKSRGNHNGKLPIRAKEIMIATVEELFLSNVQRNIINIHGDYSNKCEEEEIIPASLKTFSKYIKSLDTHDTEYRRKGKRAAYQIGTFYWTLEQNTPRHGDRPFEIAHLDHTELDIELLHDKTFKNLGRPWLTLLIDAYSRRILAFCISYEPPSYRSCMLVMKDCVRRHNRLPQTIVVDNGNEFNSIYFEKLLAMYVVTKKMRPPAEPRFGSVLERMFGITNTMFIHALRGNTQIMKEVRMVTKSVNPANNAVWTLVYLLERIEKFNFEIYDTREHPALGESPRDAYDAGMAIHGIRSMRMINYDDVFRFSIMPSTNKGSSKVIISRGIKIHNVYYWNAIFRTIPGENVSVKYDPYNIGIAYAYLESSKKWVECTSEYFENLKGLTEKEFKVISTQIRRQRQLYQKNITVTARDIAKFLQESRLIEDELIESKKATEMRTAGIFGKAQLNIDQSENKYESNQLPITMATEIYEELNL